jgi:hypothetical protein
MTWRKSCGLTRCLSALIVERAMAIKKQKTKSKMSRQSQKSKAIGKAAVPAYVFGGFKKMNIDTLAYGSGSEDFPDNVMLT